MNVKELATKYNFEIMSGNESLMRNVTSVFCCDLLSLVMSKASNNCCWLTVMGNLNAVAVASLADISCIILCEGINMDNEGMTKAQEEDIPVLYTKEPIYETAINISKNFGK